MPPIHFDDPNLLPPEEGSPSPVIWHQWDLDRLESLITSIITAPAIGEPECFSPEEAQQWGVYAAESKDLDEVLHRASQLYEDHIDDLLSNPKRHPPDFGRLVKEFLLTRPDDLLASMRSGQTVKWEKAFRWELLTIIRKGIDTIRGEQISPEDARRDEMKAMFEELREDEHPNEFKPPESEERRCELIKNEVVLYWGGVRIDTFTDTEFQLLSMLWDHREKARELDRFLETCTLKFGWKLDRRRANFDRHKDGISKKFGKAGFEMPIRVENFKVRAWPHPQKLKKKIKASRKKDMGPA